MQSIRLESSPFLTQVKARPLTAQTPSTKSTKPLKEGFSATTRSILSFTPAVIGAINQLLLCPVFGHCALDASFAFSSQSPLFVSHRLIHFKLIQNSSPLLPLERSPFFAPEGPRTFTGYLCVPDDLGSILICAILIYLLFIYLF